MRAYSMRTFFFSIAGLGDMVHLPVCFCEPKEDYRHIRELVPYIRGRAKQILDRCCNLLHIQMNRCLETKRIRTHMEK